MNIFVKKSRFFPVIIVSLVAVLSIVSCNDDGDSKKKSKTVLEEKENVVKTFDGIMMYSYSYDMKGEMKILESWQYADEEMTTVAYYMVNEYDANGDNISSTVYDGYSFDAADPLNGYNPYQKFIYEYENHCIVRAEAYDASNTLQEWYTATYNEAGNYTSYIHYEGEGTNTVIEHRTATYDDSGKHYLVETRYFGAGETEDDIKEKWTCDYGDYLEEGAYQSEIYYKRVKPSGEGVNASTGDEEGSTNSTPENEGYSEEFLFEYLWEGTVFCIMKNKYIKSTNELMQTVLYTPIVIDEKYYMGRRSEVVQGEMSDLRYYSYDPVGKYLSIELYLFEGENKTKRISSTETYEYSSKIINGEMANLYTVTYYFYTYIDDEEDSETEGESRSASHYIRPRIHGFQTVGWAKDDK